jgi:hypothetical protein
MPSAASVLHGATQRKKNLTKGIIPGERSLHRGIHVHENQRSVAQWKRNPTVKRKDEKELMVHHQKIDAELKDIYSRTAALTKDNMTMAERIEQSWKDFEMIGGTRPKKQKAFRDHLNEVREKKTEMRSRAAVEFAERGEFTDYSKGSALHDMKDRRIKKFVKGQLDRAHTLRRFSDPTPLKQSGTFDRHNQTFTMFKKTLRQMNREIAKDEKIGSVKERRKGARSMWDLDTYDVNGSQGVLKSQRDANLDLDHPRPRKKQRR